MSRREGFTLLEVMLAVFVLGTVMGALVMLVTENLARVGEARRDLEALHRGQERVEELVSAAAGGNSPGFGDAEGMLDDPNSEYAFQLSVEPYSISLPPDYEREGIPSSVFAPWSEQPTPVAPSLRLVSLRVYPLGRDPEQVEPFVMLLVSPFPGLRSPTPGAGAGREESQ